MGRGWRITGGAQRGLSLVEMLVATALLGGIILGILPLMHTSARLDRGSRNTTESSYVASEIMEILKMYRKFQLDGAVIPAELGQFTPDTPDPYEVDGTGVWGTLGVDPTRFEMTYTLTNDPLSGGLVATVSVRSQDPMASGSGGDKWVEYVSAIE